MICNCGNFMTDLTYFWECRVNPDEIHSGCGRVEKHSIEKIKINVDKNRGKHGAEKLPRTSHN